MKTIGLSLMIIGLALSAATPSAFAQANTFTIESHTEGGGGYFTLEGQTTHNPTLTVTPGAQFTVTLKGTDDGVHNFCVGSVCTDFVTAAGETQTKAFTAPASGEGEYHCQPHASLGMKGTISTGSTTTGTPSTTPAHNDTKGSPGLALPGIALALVGAALVFGRRK